MSRRSQRALAWVAASMFGLLGVALAKFVVFEANGMEREATIAAWIAAVPTFFFGALLAVCVLSYALAGVVYALAFCSKKWQHRARRL